jgi:CheY-like chemotaxis protein
MLYPLSYGGSEVAKSTRGGGAGPMHDPPLVLVVDDTANVRELIRVNLALEGFEVRVAVDGQQALDLVAELEPDLITMDVVMPRLDGLAAATRLKADPATGGIPIVMVTARAQTADRDKGRRAGVDAYITKPFEPSELVATVRNLLDARR